MFDMNRRPILWAILAPIQIKHVHSSVSYRKATLHKYDRRALLTGACGVDPVNIPVSGQGPTTPFRSSTAFFQHSKEEKELSPYSTKKRVGVGSSLRHLTHEMYMPNAKTRRQVPNATYIPLEYRLRLLPNAKKSTHKN